MTLDIDTRLRRGHPSPHPAPTWHLPLLETYPALDWRAVPILPESVRDGWGWHSGVAWRHPVERLLIASVKPHYAPAPNPSGGQPIWELDGWEAGLLFHIPWPPERPNGGVIPWSYTVGVLRTPTEAMRAGLEAVEQIAAEWAEEELRGSAPTPDPGAPLLAWRASS